MAEWAIVLVGTGLTAVAGLIRYGLRLAFLRHVYNQGGRKDLDAAARATGTRPMITRRCSCHHGRGNLAIAPQEGLEAVAEFKHALVSKRTMDDLASAGGRTDGQKPKHGPPPSSASHVPPSTAHLTKA